MKITILPNHIHRDPRANPSCPLDHTRASNWVNTMVYTEASHVPFSNRVGPLSIKMLQAHREVYAEIAKLPSVRWSTRVEIYRRLHFGYSPKDFRHRKALVK